MQKAFKRVEGDVGPDTRKALKAIAVPVQARAKANAPVLTGALQKSIKISATNKRLSVYSNVPYAGIQDRGGRVGNKAVISRASASGYMTKAVQQGRAEVEAALVALGRDIEQNFGGRT